MAAIRDMISRMISRGWLCQNGLDRHRPLWVAMQISLFFIGALFWIDSMNGAQGFVEGTWGSFAYQFPAAMWAAVAMAASSMIIVGLLKPIKSWMVSVGSTVFCANFLLLSYSAVFTGGVVVVGLYASLFFLPLHMWLLVEALTRAD